MLQLRHFGSVAVRLQGVSCLQIAWARRQRCILVRPRSRNGMLAPLALRRRRCVRRILLLLGNQRRVAPSDRPPGGKLLPVATPRWYECHFVQGSSTRTDIRACFQSEFDVAKESRVVSRSEIRAGWLLMVIVHFVSHGSHAACGRLISRSYVLANAFRQHFRCEA